MRVVHQYEIKELDNGLWEFVGYENSDEIMRALFPAGDDGYFEALEFGEFWLSGWES